MYWDELDKSELWLDKDILLSFQNIIHEGEWNQVQVIELTCW